MMKTKFYKGFMLITVILMLNPFHFTKLEAPISSIPKESQSTNDTVYIGKSFITEQIDPVFSYNTFAWELHHHVCECLFTLDFTKSDTPVIPRLANDYGTWNANKTEYTVSLRQDVTFHNGYAFNASTVQFTFDRINTLLDQGGVISEPLFKFYSNKRIINHTEVIDPYKIKFVLNYPFLSFPQFLTIGPTAIVEEHSIPSDTELLNTSILVGTGPFIYVSRNDSELRLQSYPNYYRGEASIKNIVYKLYSSSAAASQALLDGDLHLASNLDYDYLNSFLSSENLMVQDPVIKAEILILGMNNDEINSTMRRAISHAINYDYILSNIVSDKIQMTSIVPPEIEYHKDCSIPSFDFATARQILIQNHLSQNLTTNSFDYEWFDLAFHHPIMEVNYSFPLGVSDFYIDLGNYLKEQLRYLGISITLDPYDNYWNYATQLNSHSGLYCLGWTMEMDEPSNIINNFFQNTSDYNFLHVNDTWLEDKMVAALYEEDEVIKKSIYYDIQDYIATTLIPCIPLGYSYFYPVHSYAIKNIPFNQFNQLYLYDCQWDVDSDTDGIIDSKEINFYFTNYQNNDTDGDGILDGIEILLYHTDPVEKDSDSDGMDDGWEILNNLDPLADDSQKDGDNDGLFNLDEYSYLTNPNNSDSDGDGILDGEEVVIGADGFITYPTLYDSDNDGFSDGEEINRHTNPLDPNQFPTFYSDNKDLIQQIAIGAIGAGFTAGVGFVFKNWVKKRRANKAKKK